MAEATLISVPAGTTVTRETKNLGSIAPFSVQASPGASGTALVEVTCYPDPIAAGSAATWIQWGAGTVDESTLQVIVGAVTGIRFTAGTSAAEFAISGENLAKYLVGLRDTFSSISRTGVGPLMLLSADVPDASAANIGQEIIVVDENGGQRKISNGASFVDSAAPVNAGDPVTSTWAARGSGVLYQEKVFTNIGNQPVVGMWDGTRWVPSGGRQLIYSSKGNISGASATTSVASVPSVTIPGSLLGVDGGLDIEIATHVVSGTVTTSNTISLTFDGYELAGTDRTTNRRLWLGRRIRNMGAANAQTVMANAGATGAFEGAANDPKETAKNTANDFILVGTCTAVAATAIVNRIDDYKVWWIGG